jgi:RNA polymerase sigma-70 factor (ECF subfamily)
LYLARTTGDDRLADDLLQETYYRFLRTRANFESDDHRRHYLFRIATNLVKDQWRRSRPSVVDLDEVSAVTAAEDVNVGDGALRRMELTRALGQLKPRERTLLWLAYAQGFSHEEIASQLGLRTGSLKALLFRARRRLATLLGNPGSGGRP